MMIRIGHGYDVHAFAEGRKCIIGGVELPCEKGLLGHSDADVLLHAIADSLLGALALGDIGKYFPDTDPRFEGMNSLVLLRETYALVQKEGYHLVNVDSVVIAQTPHLSPHIDKMRENIASALQTTPDFISVKATTEEHLGFTGRKEGIAAHAVCLLEK